MRERILAVGCGGLLLLLAFAMLAVIATDAWRGDGLQAAGIGAVVVGSMTILAFLSFAIAIRRTPDDEDLFEGKRGLAVSLTLIVVIAVIGFAIALYLQPDFWRGAAGH